MGTLPKGNATYCQQFQIDKCLVTDSSRTYCIQC